MKYMFFAPAFLLIFSCRKSPDPNFHIASIRHYAGLGDDTLYYHYNKNRIDYVSGWMGQIKYVYENNKIVQRNTFEHGQLIQTDSISYDNNDNIKRFVAHRFQEAGTPYERDQVDFSYQNNQLISAVSQYGDNYGYRSTVVEFSWTNGNISKMLFKNNGFDDSTVLNFSEKPNPFTIFGPQVLLLDPGLDFARYTNLKMVAYLYSQHVAVSGKFYFGTNSSYPLFITMETNANGNISVFGIVPTDEAVYYTYAPDDN